MTRDEMAAALRRLNPDLMRDPVEEERWLEAMMAEQATEEGMMSQAHLTNCSCDLCRMRVQPVTQTAPTTAPKPGCCERCGMSLGVRLTSERGMTWSWEHRKWLDLCWWCASNLLHHERCQGLPPKTRWNG